MTDTPSAGAASAAPVTVDLRRPKPWLTALVRWLIHGVGVWLITRGMSEARSAALEPILTGIFCSLGALAWSLLQKELQRRRELRAAKADPRTVRLWL